MQVIYVYLFIACIMSASTYGQSCTCTCGSSTYSPTGNCSSGSSCAITCNSRYSACTGSNTYGCCGSSCIFYSSAVKCNCRCSSTSSGTPYFVGTASVNLCTTTSCKLACSSTYPSTCRVYNNQAYCSHATRQRPAISTAATTLSFLALYFSSKCFGQ